MKITPGMKVRIIGNKTGSCNKVGDIGVVDQTDFQDHGEEFVFRVKVKGRRGWGNFTDIRDVAPYEKVTEVQYEELV